MKSLFALAFLSSASLVATTVQGQRLGTSLGPITGLSLSVLDGQINRSAVFKPGFVGGVAVLFRVSPVVAIQPEMVFAQQGTDNKLNFAGISAKNSIKLNYLNVPVFLKIYVGKVVNFQFGPQFGILLSGRRVGQSSYFTGSYGSGYQTEDTDITASFKNDFALCGGIGIDLANGFTSSLRINYGFSDINNDAQDKVVRDYLGIGGIHNRGIQLTVGYLFDFGKNK